ncbi:MAG TPA: site-specific integrase [Acidobacteriaceae bacterium]|nr:site-specific integrase [Acidobacteriaceae bacterium]
MSLFQLPDSRYWWYSFYFEGKRYCNSTKQTKRTAAAVVEATLLASLHEGRANTVQRKKPPTLREFSVRFLQWVENSQRLSPNGKRYYLYGWRLLSYSKLAGMTLDQITQDIAESVVFKRPAIDRKKKDADGKYVTRNELLPCTGHYTNQALRTLKRMQSKALEWKVLRETSRITLAEAPGRDRLIDDRTEDHLEHAYREPIRHRRTRRMREQAWLVMVILQDCGMRPDEVFPMRIENLHWDANRIWIPEGKTEKARRFVAMSERVKTMLRQWCGERKEGWVFPSPRSKSGHLTSIAKGFQAARNRAGLDKKLVPYSARHTYGTYTMEKSRNAFAVAKSMGHVDLKSMEPYQHQELEPLREIINQRNQRKKFGQVFGQVLENKANGATGEHPTS